MDAPLQEWLDGVDDRWRRTGVPAVGRGRLRRELERDVADAIRGGAGTRDLTAADPDEFADQVARAHGQPPPPVTETRPSTGRVAATALGGAAIGAAVAWLIAWPIVIQLFTSASDNVLVAIAYPIGAILVVLGAVVALRERFGVHASIGRVVLPSLIGLATGCLLGLPITLLIARSLAYPTNAALVLLEALPMFGLAVGGIYLARRVLARESEPASA